MAGVEITQIGTRVNENGDQVVRFSIVLTSEPDTYVAVVLTGGDDTEAAFTGTSVFPQTSPVVGLNVTPFAEDINTALADAGIATSFDTTTLEATPPNVVVFAPRLEGIDQAIEESTFSTAIELELTGINDLVIDGDQVVTFTPVVITGSLGVSDEGDEPGIAPGPDAESYVDLPATEITDGNGNQITTLTVTNTDNQGFTIDVSPVNETLDEEDQSVTGSYTITLAETPTEPIEITIDGGNSVEVSVDGGTTFAASTAVTFAVGQTEAEVVVRASDDAIDQGGPYTATVTHQVTVATSEYPANVPIPDVDISVLDNEMPIVSLGAVTDVAEDSTSAVGSVLVSLDKPAPTGGLVVPYTVSGTAIEGTDFETLSGTVTFAEGETSAVIEVTPIADDRDEDTGETVIITIDESFTDYRVGETGSATIGITDNDTAGVIISETDLAFDEGGTASYTVVLTSDPGFTPGLGQNLVSIQLGGIGALEIGGDVSISAAFGTRLNFTTDDWDIPKTVTVSLPRDGAVTGDRTFNLTHTVLASREYNGLPAPSVAVEVGEVDTPAGFLITPGEQGLTGFDLYGTRDYPETFNLALTSIPLEDVIIRVTHDYVPGETVNGRDEPPISFFPNSTGSASNETLLFLGPDNTDVDVTLERLVGSFFSTAVDLGEVDLNLTFEVLPESDAQYAGLTIDPLEVTVVPRFEADLEFTATDGTDLDQPLVLNEGDIFDAGFRIEQSTFPLGDVAFRVSVSEGIEFDVVNTTSTQPLLADDVTSFDFGVINRNTDGLEFRFTATDDDIDRATDLSAQTFEGEVTIEVLPGTTAPEYADLTFEPFTVTVNENDLAGITETETDGDSVAVPGGRADVIQIDFDSRPTAPVTISVTTNEDIEAVTDIVVQPEDWATTVEIPLAAVLDGDDGDETVSVSYALSSADPKYDGLGGSVDVLIPDLLDNAELAEGLDTALDELQSITNSALDFDLLFVDTSEAMPDMISIFKDDLVAAIEEEDSEDPDTLVGLIEDTIESAFDGIRALRGTEATVEIGLDPSAISFDVVLEFDDSIETPINADFGIPALGFELEGDIVSEYGYSLGFGFGIDREDGFFLNTETTALEASGAIGLGGGFEAGGNIGPVGLTATNNEDNPTGASVDFTFGIADPNDDGKLTLAEIRANDTADLFDTTFSAGANVGLDFETSFSARAAQFPSFVFTLDSAWDAITFEDGELTFGGAPDIAFNDIGVNIGTFLNRFAEPILSRVDGYIDPIRPVLEALQTDIPFFDEFGIERIEGNSIRDDDGNITILSVLEAVQNVQAFQDFGFNIRVSSFISALDQLQQMIADVSEASTLAREEGGGLVITLGSYEIDLDADTFDAEEGSAEFEEARTGIQNSTPGGAALLDPTERVSNVSDNSTLNSRLLDITNAFGFQSQRIEFPVVQDVENIFGLLTGSATDVSLFEVNFPTFVLQGGFEVPIPIFSPLGFAQPTLDIGGSIGVEATFGVGYDTQGFFDWAEEYDFAPEQAFRILDGLYLTDTRDGEDIDELVLTASVQGSLGIKGVARGTGGLEGYIGLDFNDSRDAYGDVDGKIRIISEIGERFVNDPTKIFNFTGALSAFVEGYLIGVGSERAEIELVRVEIVDGEFSISTAFDGPLNGSKVYFDSNFNGIQDDFEPWTITGADSGDGSYELAINLATFDVNGNGVLDASEGRIVVEDGIDLDTFQLQEIAYTSQPGWAVINPLTLLATELGGVNPDDTQAALRAAFGLPEGFVLGADDPLEGILAGDAGGAAAFKLLAMVDNLLILGANTLGEPLEVTADELVDNVYEARDNDTRETGGVAIIAELGALVAEGGVIDLTDEATLRTVIEAAADAVGVIPADLDAALIDLVARNTAINAITETGEAGRAAVAAQVAFDDVDTSYDVVRGDLLYRLVVASRETPDIDASVAQVAAAFDLPDSVDLTSFNAIDALEAGDADGLAVYAIGNQINATLVALNSVTANPVGDLAALLDVVGAATEPVDLTDADTIAGLIDVSAPDLDDEVVDALAEAIAGTNADIQEVVDNAAPGDDLGALRNAVAQIQSFSQETKTEIYTSVATGETPAEDLPGEIDAAIDAGVFRVETDEDTPVTANLVEDIEAATEAEIVIVSVEGETASVGETVEIASGALVTIDLDGNLTYDPNGAFASLDDGEEAYDVINYELRSSTVEVAVPASVTVQIAGLSSIAPSLVDVLVSGSGDTPVSPGEVMTVAGSFTDPELADTHSVLIDWGDGTTSSSDTTPGDFDLLEVSGGGTGAFEALHTYDEAGIYTVTTTVLDQEGAAVSSTSEALVTGARLLEDTGELLLIGTGERDLVSVIQDADDGAIQVVSTFFEDGFESFGRDEVTGVRIVTAGGRDPVIVLGDALVPTSIETGSDRDAVLGGRADNVISGGDGRDRLAGGLGDDTINGDADNDTLFGNAGNDTVLGGAGNDRVFGGAGDDRLDGGLGDDSAAGGIGADVFVLAVGAGTDTIRDFEDGIDLLELDAALGFDALSIDQDGLATTISTGGDVLAVLQNVSATTISEDDFVFV